MIHTNSAEGYFSIFKRGMKGVYQQCAEKHLHRYLAEFDFRYNNRVALGVDDQARADARYRASSASASPMERPSFPMSNSRRRNSCVPTIRWPAPSPG